jgi:hypothetical protein
MPALKSFFVGYLLFAGALGATRAALLEHAGTPDPAPAAVAHYGFGVEPRLGLRSVVPAGWRILVHRSAQLPEAMSWSLGQPWPQALEAFAKASGLSVFLDWEQRQVLVRPPEVAKHEREVRQSTYLAATTPLPRFEAAPPARAPALWPATAPAAPAPEEGRAAAASSGVPAGAPSIGPASPEALAGPRPGASVSPPRLADEPALPVAAPHVSSASAIAPSTKRMAYAAAPPSAAPTAPAPAAESPAQVAAPPVQVSPTPPLPDASPAAPLAQSLAYTAATAFNRPSGRALAQAIAQRFGVRLYWMGPDLVLPGPVTLLARSVEQDVGLMRRALGPASALELSHDAQAGVIRVVNRAPAAEPEQGLARGPLRLDLHPALPVERALTEILQPLGYRLDWQADEALYPTQASRHEHSELSALMRNALRPLGLVAEVRSRERRVAVRPASAAAWPRGLGGDAPSASPHTAY